MNKAHRNYLASIGMQAPFIERTSEVYALITSVIPHKFDDFYVCDVVDNEKNRKYTSLWLFARGMVVESKNYLTMEKMDFARVDKVKYYELSSKDYDYRKANENSRLSVDFKFYSSGPDTVGGQLIASGVNCDYLMTIFKKYIQATA